MKRFVIFGQGRNGSHLLVSLLNSHPAIHCYGEVFHPNRWRSKRRQLLMVGVKQFPLLYLQTMMFFRHEPVIGFKLLTGQNIKFNNVLKGLIKANWQIIHLRRRYLFSRALSMAVLMTTGVSHSHDQPRHHSEKVMINPELFSNVLRNTRTSAEAEELLLKNVACLKLDFESDLADQQALANTGSRVLEFLDLPVLPLQTNVVKTWDQPYSELVLNYSELVELAAANGLGLED